MPLAKQTYNPGKRGQNARYDVRGLQRGERGFFDGQYWYDENGLSLDRPDAIVRGLRGADEMDGREAWDSGIGGVMRGSSGPARGFSLLPSGIGQLPPFGYEGQAPSMEDWAAMAGQQVQPDEAIEQMPTSSQDPLTQALAAIAASVPNPKPDPFAGFGGGLSDAQRLARRSRGRKRSVRMKPGAGKPGGYRPKPIPKGKALADLMRKRKGTPY